MLTGFHCLVDSRPPWTWQWPWALHLWARALVCRAICLWALGAVVGAVLGLV